MPRVSVLLTSFKHERYLRSCIESALSQTFEDFEVIAVDDNSPDASPKILSEYSDRVHVILNKENRGTYAVLNQALEIASGEYCAVLNSDDLWLPDKLSKQVQLMSAEPETAFCHTFGEFIDQDGAIIDGKPMGFAFPRTPSGDCLPIFIANNTAIASSVMFRTALAREIGGFDTRYRNLGDWDMWLRLAERGPVAFCGEKLTLYRVHATNTIRATEVTREEELRLRVGVWERREALPDSPELRLALAHSAACIGSLFSISGDAPRARAFFADSLRLNPRRVKSALRWLLTFAPLALRKRTL
jgi:glycosyltransferase involved in cell wall biosynthesis